MFWALTMLLWLPWIDYGKSYRPVAQAIKAGLRGNAGCIASRGLGEAQRAAFDYHAEIVTERSETHVGRKCGMLLVQGLMNYLASNSNDTSSEAYALGYDYASRARRYGLSAVDATRAFLFFRNTLLEALVSAYEDARVPPGLAWGKMLNKIHTFTDAILVNLIKTYLAMEDSHS